MDCNNPVIFLCGLFCRGFPYFYILRLRVSFIYLNVNLKSYSLFGDKAAYNGMFFRESCKS